MADAANSNAGKKRGRPFEKGQVANPAGRPKGARNKLGEDFIQALAEDFAAEGVQAIRAMREEKPNEYVKVVASLLPKHVEVKDVTLDEFDRDELANLLDVVRATRAIREASGEGAVH